MPYHPVDHPPKECGWCGTVFKPKTKRSDYCCKECRLESIRKPRAVRPPKVCEECGDAYAPKANYTRSRFCSRSCKIRFRSRQRRGPICTCRVCGSAFFATRNSAEKYCSRDCYYQSLHKTDDDKRRAMLRRIAGKFSPVEWRECICCGDMAVGPRPDGSWAGSFCKNCRDSLGTVVTSFPGRIDFMRVRLNGRSCEVCGETFTPYTEASTCCSSDCLKQTERHKACKRIAKHRRRSRKKTGTPGEAIDPMVVFDDAGWRCSTCGVYTPKSLRGTCDDRAPELDHVVPLAAGGTHTRDNVRLCCRACNQEQGARIFQMDFFVGANKPQQNQRGGRAGAN